MQGFARGCAARALARNKATSKKVGVDTANDYIESESESKGWEIFALNLIIKPGFVLFIQLKLHRVWAVANHAKTPGV